MSALCGLGWLAAGAAFVGWWLALRGWRRSIDRLSAAWQRQLNESARMEREREERRMARFLADLAVVRQRIPNPFPAENP